MSYAPEKFAPVRFLITFPSYNISMKADIEKLKNRTSSQQTVHSTLHLTSILSDLTITCWMINQLEIEVEKSRAEVEKIRNETATFLHTESEKATGSEDELILVLSLCLELECSGAE